MGIGGDVQEPGLGLDDRNHRIEQGPRLLAPIHAVIGQAEVDPGHLDLGPLRQK